MAKIGDICEILDSNRVPITATERQPGPYPYYGANGIQDYVADYIFDDELVLLAEDGGNFGSKDKPIAYRVSGKCWVNNHAHVLKPKEGLDVDYLCYSLMFYDVTGLVNGATRQKLTQADMRKMEIPLPPLDEQRKIAAVLDKVNDLIAKRRQQLDKLDELVKARFVEMFDLSACTYGMLCDNTEFVDYRGHTPTLSDDGNIRMVNAKSVGKGVFKYVEEYVTEKTYDSWMHRGFGYPGDVLFVTEGHTFGNACQVPQGLTKFALGQRVITIQGHRGIINNAFLCAYMQTDKFIKDIAMYKTGGTAQGIRSKDLGKVKVPLYPYGQQETFEKFVDQTEKTKTTISRSLEKLETLKKALMQEYFG